MFSSRKNNSGSSSKISLNILSPFPFEFQITGSPGHNLALPHETSNGCENDGTALSAQIADHKVNPFVSFPFFLLSLFPFIVFLLNVLNIHILVFLRTFY